MRLKLLKKIVGIFGYKLIEKNLIKNDRLITKGTYFKLEKILEKLFLLNKIDTLIQIGANDGVRFDILNSFIKKYSPKVIFVEPIKSNYEQLRLNYKHQNNVYFENSAVSVKDKISYLYKVKDSALIKYDDHIAGVTSFSKKHLLKHGVRLKDIIKEIINPITISELLDKHTIDKFDLLYIDTEGYDSEIVNDFLKTSTIRPFIVFEYIHVDTNSLEKSLINLKEKNFLYFKIEENIIAIPSEKQKNLIF